MGILVHPSFLGTIVPEINQDPHFFFQNYAIFLNIIPILPLFNSSLVIFPNLRWKNLEKLSKIWEKESMV